MGFIEEYNGPLLNPNDMPNGHVKCAYISYRGQRTRCYNKKGEKYKNYGARGIKVKYSSRQFIAWWIKEITKKSIKNPTISRIDHNGHYEFGNIKIESRSDNTKERNKRIPSHLKARPVYIFNQNGTLLAVAKSINHASRLTEVGLGSISSYCKYKNHRKTLKHNFIFEYA